MRVGLFYNVVSCSIQATLDERGIGGYDAMEAVADKLLQLSAVASVEGRRTLTNLEANQLDALVQRLSPFDRRGTFSPRAKRANRGGRFQRKKGEGDPEVEACAK